MKALEYKKYKQKLKVWMRAFRIWQRRPHQVAPLSEDIHPCASCGTEFQGNYCPRCGQSASIARFSFKKAFLLFLDVWGMGNRGMFRSIWDLMLRPGYMIRDYISGMQSAYFPPFKMFFLLTAFFMIVEHGFTLGLNDEETEAAKEPTVEINESEIDKDTNAKDAHLIKITWDIAKKLNTFRKNNQTIFAFLSLVLFSLPLYIFFRKSPAIPDLRYSEFVVALVYTSNTFSIYSIIGSLLNSSIINDIAVLMIFIALKQFSGFKKRRVLLYIILSTLIVVLTIAVVAGTAFYIIYQTA